MIQVFILNGSEYALNLFNNFEIRSYACKFAIPMMFIFKEEKLFKKITNFNPEYLYGVWSNLCSYQMT